MSKNWFKDSITYHIFIDRFAGFDGKKDDSKPDWVGGNLKAIAKKLPYLKKLGINCIWLSPFYKTSAYHGYWIEDYYEVDEHFGTKKDLKELVANAHKLGIKVIADFVPNHCSDKHPFFIDAASKRDSKYRDWFYFKQWPFEYLSFLDYKNLPKLNLENKEVRKYVIDAAVYWLKNFDLDGFRLDHAIGPSLDFWQEFKTAVKKAKSSSVLIGEVWFLGVNESHEETIKMKNIKKIFEKHKKSGVRLEDLAMQEFVNILDGCLDFTFNDLIRRFLAKREISSEIFFSELNHHYSLFPSDFMLPSFLDNHDMNRFLFECGKDENKLKLASVLQFCLNQPPIIYYGTEAGLSQASDIKDFESNGDVQARRTMMWDEEREDLFNHYRRLCLLRSKIKSMREGKLKIIYTDVKSGLLAFVKESESDKILAILNPDDVEVGLTLNLKQFGIECKYLVDLILDEKIEVKESVVKTKLKPYGFGLYLIK